MLRLLKGSLVLILFSTLSAEMYLPLLIRDAQTWGFGNPRFVLISGPTAVTSNPTRINGRDGISIYGSHSFWFLGMRKEQLALSRRFSIFDLGVSIDYFDYGDLEEYPDYPSGEPIGTFPAFDFVVTPAVSIKIPRGRMGLNCSYLYELIYDESYNSYCLDLTLDYQPIDRMNFVIGLGDFNPGIRKDTNRFYPPVTLGGGFDYRLRELTFGAELGYLIHSEDWTISAGAKYAIQPIVIRAGLFYLDKITPTVGIGYASKMIQVDLGLASHPHHLGLTEHIGVGINF